MLVELSTRETQALYFSLAGIGWSLGFLTAPIIGGYFSSISSMPRYIQDILNEHPYALPGFVVGLYGLAAAAVGTFVLQETLLEKNRRPLITQLSFHKSEEAQSAPLLGMFTRSSVFMLGLRFGAIVS